MIRCGLCFAAACLVLTGCHVVGDSGGRSGTQPRIVMSPQRQSSSQKETGSSLRSWFGLKEPSPPKSVREWMDLEPIRP